MAEMIAMLGGLGATPQMSAEAVSARNLLLVAKTAAEIDAIVDRLPVLVPGSLSERDTLRIYADLRKREIAGGVPFYKKPLYWAVVAVVVGGVVLHWPKVKRAIGLGGAGDSFRKGINPSGKLPAARPKAGYGQESNFRAQEDRAIARLDEYFGAKREAARQARKAAKRAAKKKGGR